MSSQLALFDAPKTPADQLVGSQVKLPDPCECGCGIATVGPGKAQHKASLTCASCGRHRGWLSHNTYAFIAEIINKFGCPTTPIVIRRGRCSPKGIDDAGF
jgi:hypothetical protein